MKNQLKKLWVVPFLGVFFFWGVGMIASPKKQKTFGEDSLYFLAAADINSLNKNWSANQKESEVTIRGTIVRFKEHDQLVLDDGTERLAVDYSNKHMPLKLKVGDVITVRGQLSAKQNNRELAAAEIYNSNGKVYPQKVMATQVASYEVVPPNAKTSNPDNDNSDDKNANDNKMNPMKNHKGNKVADMSGENMNMSKDMAMKPQTMKIADVKSGAKVGDVIVLEGTVKDFPKEKMLILEDASGNITIDVDDAVSNLKLNKGDKIKVTGKVMEGNQVQATKINK